MMYRGPIVPKPRMTRRDKWAGRSCVNHYHAFCDLLRLEANIQGYKMADAIEVVIYIPMPKSWSMKKREEMHEKPHKQRPDADNILKGICDALNKEDSYIYHMNITKRWSNDTEGEIYIFNSNNEEL